MRPGGSRNPASRHGTPEVAIRLAVPEDAAAIADVHIGSWRVAYRGIVPQDHLDGLDQHEWVERRRQQLSAPGRGVRTYLAEQGTTLVGFVALGPERSGDVAGGAWEIYAIYVQPSSWSAGVGRLLLRRAVDDAPADTPLVLWVLEDNLRARRFYEAAGLVPDGARTTISIGGAELPEVRYRLDRPDRQGAEPLER